MRTQHLRAVPDPVHILRIKPPTRPEPGTAQAWRSLTAEKEVDRYIERRHISAALKTMADRAEGLIEKARRSGSEETAAYIETLREAALHGSESL